MATVESPKDLIGCWNFRLEITYGNQQTVKVIKNPDDILDIENKDIFDVAQEILDKKKAFGKKNGITWTDEKVVLK